MTTYIIDVSICWLLFFGLYYLLFRQETFFKINRWYLLLTICLGLLIPILDYSALFPTIGPNDTLKMSIDPIVIGVQNFENNLEEIVVTPITNTIDYAMILNSIYWIGFFLCALRFVIGLFKIGSIFKYSEKVQKVDHLLIKTKEPHLPFSFFKFLFWSDKLALDDVEKDKIMKHEMVHIEQGHSYDVLFLQILQIVFWCSPLIYFYNRSLRNVHEYLADDEVLQTSPTSLYGKILIKQSSNGFQFALANNFIHSQLKNRIAMMTKSKSNNTYLTKYLFAFPVLALLFFSFSTKHNLNTFPIFENSESALILKDSVYKTVDQMPAFQGCADVKGEEKTACSQNKLLMHVYTNIKYPAEARTKGTQGIVVVKFIVTKEGYVSRPEIMRGLGDGCDKAVIEIVRNMPQWEAGQQDGQAVNVEYVLPVKFQLEGDPPAKDETIYSEVDEMPRFKGCEEDGLEGEELKKCATQKLLMHIYTNIKYPQVARDAEVQGTVISDFVIDQEGKIKDVKILKGPDSGLHAEVLRVVSEMPNWVPGKKDGKLVNTSFILPVKFQLEPKAVSDKKEINNTLKLTDLNISPNPSKGNVNISFNSAEGDIELQVMDVNGKLLKTYSEKSTGFLNTSLDLSSLPKGTVLINIIQDGKSYTEKVILQ